MNWFKTVKLEDSCFKGLNTVLHCRTGTGLVAIVVDIANETKAAAHNTAQMDEAEELGIALPMPYKNYEKERKRRIKKNKKNTIDSS